jgi:hypothetical protein
MVYAPSKELRDCLVAARGGDSQAAKEILRAWGYPKIAKEIRSGKPWTNRARRAIDCLTAAVGCPEWERIRADGSIENLLISPPPPEGTARNGRFDD